MAYQREWCNFNISVPTSQACVPVCGRTDRRPFLPITPPHGFHSGMPRGKDSRPSANPGREYGETRLISRHERVPAATSLGFRTGASLGDVYAHLSAPRQRPFPMPKAAKSRGTGVRARRSVQGEANAGGIGAAGASVQRPSKRRHGECGLKSRPKKSRAASKSMMTLSRERRAQRVSGNSFISLSASQFSPAL